MAEEKIGATHIPTRAKLESDPKVDLEEGHIPYVLRAFYLHTQPIVEEYVATRRLITDFQKNPGVTDKDGKTKMYKDAIRLLNMTNAINHAERKIRGLPYDEDEADKGIHYARNHADEQIKNKPTNPDDARAAEVELVLLKQLG